MAGGVWHLRDWRDWLDNAELGPIGFQFGTRPLLTRESPISGWKRRLLELEGGDVLLHQFSPTGFYSSRSTMRSCRSCRALRPPDPVRRRAGRRARPDRAAAVRYAGPARVHPSGRQGARGRLAGPGLHRGDENPENTLIYVAPDKAEIRRDRDRLHGLRQPCQFSNWACRTYTTGKPPDPRSFCIQKTLQDIAHSGAIDTQLMFAGHENVYRFRQDPFYSNGFIPSVRQLVERIATGH